MNTDGSGTLRWGRCGSAPAAVLAVVGLLLAGCADDVALPDPAARTPTATIASPDSSPAEPSRAEPSAVVSSPTEPAPVQSAASVSPFPPTDGASSGAPSPAPSPAPDEAGLPGEPYDDLYVDEGDVLGVIGVRHDDVLNVRARPGTDTEVVATAAPTAYGLVATGRSRVVGDSFWHEVTIDDVTGWVSWRYVSFIGPTIDDTARFVAQHGDHTAPTIEELGRHIAEHYESHDVASRVVMSGAPSVGDLGEVTYDVVGLADDAGAGYRVHVFGCPVDDGAGFSLEAIELTDLCLRGGSPDGICV